MVVSDRLPPFERKLLVWGKRKKSSRRRSGEQGIFLEGSKLIEEAIAANHPIEAAWYTKAFATANNGLIRRLTQGESSVREVSTSVMKAISEQNNPQGIVAVGPQPGFIHRKPDDPFSLIVVLTLVQDPGNLGGVVRTADYFGVDEIWLGQRSVDPYGPKALRGMMGSGFRMPVIRGDDIVDRIKRFRRAGAEVWAAVAHGDDAEHNISPSGRRILMIGAESSGISQEYMDLADRRVFIPGARRSESLNLSVAAGVLIYAATSGRYQRTTL